MQKGFIQHHIKTSIALSALFSALIVAGLASTASAQQGRGLTVFGGTAFSGESDTDEIDIEGVGEIDGDDEDVESNLGVGVRYDIPIARNTFLGVQGQFFTGEGDDSETLYRTIDAQLLFLYFIPAGGGFAPFVGGGGGLTYAFLFNDEDNQETEVSGFGFNIQLGGGAVYAIGNNLDLFGGLFYLYQAAGSLEGEADPEGADKVDVELKDNVLTRVLLTVGVKFGL